MIAIGNHWPSRIGGEKDSAPYRMLTGETLSYWMEQILEIKGKDAAVLVMGDFNDEPNSDSLEKYANAAFVEKFDAYRGGEIVSIHESTVVAGTGAVYVASIQIDQDNQ